MKIFFEHVQGVIGEVFKEISPYSKDQFCIDLTSFNTFTSLSLTTEEAIMLLKETPRRYYLAGKINSRRGHYKGDEVLQIWWEEDV